MSPELQQKLLLEQNECTLCWVRKNGKPAATIVSYVYDDGCLWMTALAGSKRVAAISARAETVVVVSGKGCSVGHSRCISMPGRCDIVDDTTRRDWFFTAFAAAVLRNSERGAAYMAQSMNSPENLVLRFTPEKHFPYDAQRMFDQADNL